MKPIFTQAEFEDFETLDDNSTGFSCRNAVDANAAPHWSNHAYGHAIDINPIENPYLNGGKVLPSAGAAFTDRRNVRPGMAVERQRGRRRVPFGRLGLGRELPGLPALLHERPLTGRRTGGQVVSGSLGSAPTQWWRRSSSQGG